MPSNDLGHRPWAVVKPRIVSFMEARRTMLGALLTLAIKGGGTMLMVAVFILAARTISPSDFGQLAVAFNALSFLAVFALFGQDTLFVRSWSEFAGRDDALAHGAFWFGWRVVGICMTASCVLVLIIGYFGSFRFTMGAVLAACAFLAGQMALQYSSNTCRHILNFVVSELNRELTWRLVLLVVVVAALHGGLSPETFFAAGAGGTVLAIAIESAALHRGFPGAVKAAPPKMHVRRWLTRARSMWVSATVEAATQYAEVMFLGMLVSPAAAGSYFVAARVANIFSMLVTGLHTYTVSYAANLFFSAQTGQLQKLIRSVMTVALLISAPILLIIILFGSRILGLFGSHYQTGFPTLVVLSAAGFTVAMAGPSPGILLTTGHERLYSRVVLAALILRVALLLWLAPRYGALGAAVAWALVNAPVAVGLTVACRSLCAVDPSALSVLFKPPWRKRSGEATTA